MLSWVEHEKSFITSGSDAWSIRWKMVKLTSDGGRSQNNLHVSIEYSPVYNLACVLSVISFHDQYRVLGKFDAYKIFLKSDNAKSVFIQKYFLFLIPGLDK